jgi:Tol biopolymer transport system component
VRRLDASIAAAIGACALIVSGAVAAQAPSDPNAQVAYAAGGRVHVIAADGSGARDLARGGGPSWSPDGTMIAFHDARVPGYGLDVYVMTRGGRDQRRLVSHPTAGGEPSDNTRDDFDPSWSPDGAFIAFVTYRNGHAEIYRMDTTGHATARLTNDPGDDRQPAWSPDGRTIAFVSNRTGNGEIHAMRADSTGVRQLSRTEGTESGPAWSPDGRLIAFESFRDGNSDIYVMDAGGGAERRLTNDPAAETSPAWSADGGSVVFTRHDDSGRRLVVMSVANGATRSLTVPSELADAGTWRPGVDLALSVSASRRVRFGQPARVRITVRNRFPLPALNVVLSISPPRTARVIGVRAPRGAFCRRQRLVTCSLRRLSSSSPMAVDVVLRPRRCGSLILRASVASAQRDVLPANNRRMTQRAVPC